jgi:hypothetical protein
MSANRDKNQRVTFVYSNLYQIYKSGKEAAQAADPLPGLPVSSTVLKTENLKAGVEIRPYEPVELIGKRIQKKEIPALAPAKAPDATVQGLKDNLKALNDLHQRLRFMLQELEDLVKE